LNRLGAARARLAERLESLANLAGPRVGMQMVVSWRPIDPIEDRGDLQNLAPGLEEIPIQNPQGLAWVHMACRPPRASRRLGLPPRIGIRRKPCRDHSFPHHPTRRLGMQISPCQTP